MNIQIIETKVDELSFRKIEPKAKDESVIDADSSPISFSVAPAFNPDERKQFAVIFKITVKTSDEIAEFSVKYVAYFGSDEDITDDERNSPFFSINAPAIGYPFLRSYISNLMLISGYEPVMLPTINFVKMAQDKAAQDKTD